MSITYLATVYATSAKGKERIVGEMMLTRIAAYPFGDSFHDGATRHKALAARLAEIGFNSDESAPIVKRSRGDVSTRIRIDELRRGQ